MEKKSKFVLKSNTELKAYDIFIVKGYRNGEVEEDILVATVYDPDYVDLFLSTLDMVDARSEQDFVSPIPDEHSVYIGDDDGSEGEIKG